MKYKCHFCSAEHHTNTQTAISICRSCLNEMTRVENEKSLIREAANSKLTNSY